MGYAQRTGVGQRMECIEVVHVLAEGRIVKTGGKELSKELEAKGYDWVLKEVAGRN